jgi:trehalose 6-phosphate phosphatase
VTHRSTECAGHIRDSAPDGCATQPRSQCYACHDLIRVLNPDRLAAIVRTREKSAFSGGSWRNSGVDRMLRTIGRAYAGHVPGSGAARRSERMTLSVTGLAYFLDIDGTLVDLADTPSTVRLDPALPGLVEALYQSSDGAVALITGRSIADADRLFPKRRLAVAGQHGHERRSARGAVTRHRVSPKALDPARHTLNAIVARHPALLFEDKGLTLALHYRRAHNLASLAHRVMHAVQSSLGEQYCVHRGKCVVELAPAGRDKGIAIASFMREAPFRGKPPVFIGDDVTDEHGFAIVNRLGGDSIKVGPGPTVATWRFPSVAAVLRWLEHGTPGPKRCAAQQVPRR